MSTAIAIRDDVGLKELANILSKSGYFQDAREAGQALVKVLAGRELGFGPIASMTGINIIQGRVALSANLMASAVKRSGRYDYRVLELTATVCRLEFFENMPDGKRDSLGVSQFTAQDAKAAGTKNMEKYPRNMLLSRAMSNGVKWYCPDVTGGPAYTPEEMGANVNEDGDVIDAAPSVHEQEQSTEQPAEPSPQVSTSAVEDARKIWQAFQSSAKPTQEQVTAALGTARVSEWLEADSARTVQDAIGLVQQKMEA